MVMVKPLSNAELEIMYLLWQEGTPLTAHQILERMPGKELESGNASNLFEPFAAARALWEPPRFLRPAAVPTACFPR